MGSFPSYSTTRSINEDPGGFGIPLFLGSSPGIPFWGGWDPKWNPIYGLIILDPNGWDPIFGGLDWTTIWFFYLSRLVVKMLWIGGLIDV